MRPKAARSDVISMAAINAGMRAKALVERILAFSRSGMGERVPVHVESVVHEALDLLAASRLPAGVQLDRQLVAGNAAVMERPDASAPSW